MSMGVSFWGVENILELDSGEGIQLCEYMNCHCILCFKKSEWGYNVKLSVTIIAKGVRY